MRVGSTRPSASRAIAAPSLFRRFARTRARTKANGLPDARISGKPLTNARRSAGVGFSGIRIRSATASKSAFTVPTEGAVSMNRCAAPAASRSAMFFARSPRASGAYLGVSSPALRRWLNQSPAVPCGSVSEMMTGPSHPNAQQRQRGAQSAEDFPDSLFWFATTIFFMKGITAYFFFS